MSNISSHQRKLFEDLHNSRAEDYKTFSKKDYRGVWKGIVDKYPETAHFVYELLQNADDAGATSVEIMLNQKQMIFKHNGTKHFNITDVNDKKTGDINAITGIGNSTKEDVANKIGKFGVGFKAVFQYTDTPEIYDEYFKFKIENYIIPTLIEGDHPLRKKGETLFLFNLKNQDKSYEEIVERIENLDSPILFLRNLLKISISITRNDLSVDVYEYSKEIVFTESYDNNVSLRKIILTSPKDSTSIFLFSKTISLTHEGIESKHDICVGYWYDEKNKKIITEGDQQIYCFFPTKEKFHTSYICHAPFLLTDSRQNLKPSEPTNEILLEVIGWLAAKSVILLRDLGLKDKSYLLNENILDILPKYHRRRRYIREIYEEPIERAFNKIIEREKIFLSRNNIYLHAEEAFIGGPKELIDLISPKQLKELRKSNLYIDFLKYDFIKKIRGLDGFMEDDFQNYTSETFAKDITATFMSNQDIKWVSKFYTFLRTAAVKLWKLSSVEKENYCLPFRNAPIIKIQDGSWVPPFISRTTPNVFLPNNSHISNTYNFIHNDLLKDDVSMKFFKELEISHPDELDYIRQVICKRYEFRNDFDEEVILSDTTFVIKYFRDNEHNRAELISLLENKDMFVNKSGILWSAGHMYFPNNQIENLLDCRIYILNIDFYNNVINKLGREIVYDFLKSLGVKSDFKLIKEKHVSISYPHISPLLKVKLSEFQKSNDVVEWKIDEYYIPNFIESVNNKRINLDLSLYIWNNILANLELDDYKVPRVLYRKYRGKSFYFCQTNEKSALRNSLQSLPWLYDVNGRLISPSKVYLEDLDTRYTRSTSIIDFLEISVREKSIVDLGGSEEQQKYYDFGCKVSLHFSNLTHEEMFKILEKASEEKRKENIVKVESVKPNGDSVNSDSPEQDLESILKDKWEKKASSSIGKPKHNSSSNEQYLGNTTFSDNSDSKSFFGDSKQSHPNSTYNEKDDSLVKSKLESKNKVAQENAQKADELVRIHELLNSSSKYSYKWFKLLMELMHADKSNVSVRHLQIDFAYYKISKDNKILHLSNPNVPIPLWILDAEKISISTLGEKSQKIDGVIIKVDDTSVEISVDNTKDLRDICKKAKKFRIVADNSTNIIDSLETRFLQLGYEDDYDMNENLTKDIEFIYGPPGTGKTTLLVKQVSEILKQSNSKTNILILTPTNKAADVIAEKMVGDEQCFKYLTRFGATESLYLIEDAGIVGNRETTNLDKSNKNIIVTTAARYAYDCIQPNDTFLCDFNWDYIIIDEASMVDIVTCTYVLYKGGSSKFIISGDPKQIQPVAQNDMPPYNIYDMVNLNEFSNAVNNYDRYKVTTLTKQYRSIPEIGNLVSEYTYNGLVQPDPNRTPQKPLTIDGLNIKNINFIGFEVQDFDLIKGLSEIDGSAFHLYSAIFTYKFAEHIIKQITSKYPGKDYSIGIVSPYRAQANSIKQMLENRPIHTDNCSVTCGTAHSFQGDECDIMLIVLNPPLQCSNKSHINNQNIINVAMSRARDYIFFVMPQGQPKGMKIKEHLNYILDKKSKGMFYCPDVENIMFGTSNFIVSNTHVTCHMPVNVYCEENSLYEVRLSNEAIDIKINE